MQVRKQKERRLLCCCLTQSTIIFSFILLQQLLASRLRCCTLGRKRLFLSLSFFLLLIFITSGPKKYSTRLSLSLSLSFSLPPHFSCATQWCFNYLFWSSGKSDGKDEGWKETKKANFFFSTDSKMWLDRYSEKTLSEFLMCDGRQQNWILSHVIQLDLFKRPIEGSHAPGNSKNNWGFISC